MKIVTAFFTRYKYLLLVILFGILSVVDLVNYGLPPTHDGEYHVLRLWQFSNVLSEGVLYPRWAPDFNNGFGIPLFNYVYPLPNYVGSIFHFLGFGLIDSFKLSMMSASIVGAIFFYLWSKRFWGELGGLVSSVFYTFSPYHLLDIYVRGSAGEVWSLALAPGLLWSYTEFESTKKNKYFVISAIMLGLLIYAHNILALVFFGFFVVYSLYLLYLNKTKGGLFKLILIILSGLGLAAPFWLPALLETKYVTGLQVFNPLNEFPVLYKLIYSSWGYGFSGSGGGDQMSFQIGVINLIVVLISIGILFFFKNKIADKEKINKKILGFFIVTFFLTVFMITPFSGLLWQNLPLISYVQFPWRLLSLVILQTSFLAGAIILITKNKKYRIILAATLIICSVVYSFRYAKAPFYHQRADSHYLTRANFTDGTNSPGDVFNTFWLSEVPPKRKELINVLDGKAKVNVVKLNSTKYSFWVNADEPSEIVVHTAYFPGWMAKVNGRDTKVKNVEGRMVLKVNKGTNNVEVKLANTTIQKISYIIFLASILLILIYIRSSREKVAKVYKVHKIKKIK